MYTFSPMMVANSRKHHCRVRSYTREVLVISTNLDIQKNHYPLDFRNRRGDEARIKNTWYNQEDLKSRGSIVSFREMITSQLQGKLRLYDEVRARTLFVLSSSNRGRLLGIIDLMRQKNKRMKQEGLNRQIGKLQDVT
ncbi:hypothetical protein Tco_0327486 [Tanacetum coccineum]